jgi:hypothetical protein
MKSNNYKNRKKRLNGELFSERISQGNDWTLKNRSPASREKQRLTGACGTVSIGNGDADEK